MRTRVESKLRHLCAQLWNGQRLAIVRVNQRTLERRRICISQATATTSDERRATSSGLSAPGGERSVRAIWWCGISCLCFVERRFNGEERQRKLSPLARARRTRASTINFLASGSLDRALVRSVAQGHARAGVM